MRQVLFPSLTGNLIVVKGLLAVPIRDLALKRHGEALPEFLRFRREGVLIRRKLGIGPSFTCLLLISIMLRFLVLEFKQLLLRLFNLEVLLDLGAMVKVSVEHLVRLLGDKSVVFVDEDRLHDLFIEDEEVLRPALRLFQRFIVHLLNFTTLHHVRMLVPT